MINNKLSGYIGLCYASKNIVLGTDNITSLLRNNKVKLILMSSRASFNTQKLVQDKAQTYHCQVILLDETDESIISRGLNKDKVVVVGIKDIGFKNMIIKAIKGEINGKS